MALRRRWQVAGGVLSAVCLFVFVCDRTQLHIYAFDKLGHRLLLMPNITCDACNDFRVPFLIENVDACAPHAGYGGAVYLLVIVLSYHPNVRARQAARDTWASVRTHAGVHVRTVFVFGVHEDANFNEQLRIEQRRYGDVIQVAIPEAYRLLTNKSVAALRWAGDRCPQARFILKTDDDSFNLLAHYVDLLLRVTRPLFVGGLCFTVTPDRRTHSKYYVSEGDYPDRYYPPYCAGPAYVVSAAAARALVRVAPHVRYLPMEDVFVTGACRAVAAIPYTQIAGTAIDKRLVTPCAVASWVRNAHNVMPEDARRLWGVAREAARAHPCATRNTAVVVGAVAFFAVWTRILTNLCRRASFKVSTVITDDHR